MVVLMCFFWPIWIKYIRKIYEGREMQRHNVQADTLLFQICNKNMDMKIIFLGTWYFEFLDSTLVLSLQYFSVFLWKFLQV